MYQINRVNIKKIDVMLKDNYNNLTAAMDDMYELGIIPSCDFFEIKDINDICGFFATNSDNVMLQFYVKNNKREDILIIFETIISNNNITKALCCSNDSIYYSLCQKKSKTSTLNDYLFIEDKVVNASVPFEGIVMSYANRDELKKVLAYFTSIGIVGDWLNYYLTQRIAKDELILFNYNDNIIGTAEIRPSISSKSYANIGMTVSKDYRRRGLGSYIITTIRKITNNNGYIAICSTDKTNIGSLKTLTKSGFLHYHTMFEITF